MNLRSLAILTVALCSNLARAQTYTEGGDVGHQGVLRAEACFAGGALTRINGSLDASDRADAYIIRVTNGAGFSAATTGLASFDTQLFLFYMDGSGLVSNDDFGAPGVRTSNITTGIANGYYILAISRYDDEPVDAAGVPIFSNGAQGLNISDSRRVWTNFNQPAVNAGGVYGISLAGASFVSDRGPRTTYADPGETINGYVSAMKFGDTLVLPPGTVYVAAPLSFAGKGATIRGAGQYGSCVLEPFPGSAPFRMFFFNFTREGPLTLIENVAIANGQAPSGIGGAGVYAAESSPMFRACVFDHNVNAFSMGDAGAALLFDSGAVFDRCEFGENSAEKLGGAVYIAGNSFYQAQTLFRNCLFHRNAAAFGGAVAVQTLRATFQNCTFTDNNSPTSALFGNFNAQLIVSSSIFFGNIGSANQVFVDSGAGATISLNGSLAPSGDPGFAAGVGNIDADPLFVSPALGDYHLGAGSPAIDRLDATNAAVLVGPEDLDGGPRVLDEAGAPNPPGALLDIGCYEAPTFSACPPPPAVCEGDADSSGVVNFLDIITVLRRFGMSCNP